jgi:hypothetical protein
MNVDFTAITPVIDGIAQKLGVAAEHVWGILVRQAINNGIGDLLISITMGISLFISYKLMKWAFRKNEYNNYIIDADFTLPMIAVFGGIGIFIIFIFCMCYFGSSIKHFVNPEYYAFMDIVRQIKYK